MPMPNKDPNILAIRNLTCEDGRICKVTTTAPKPEGCVKFEPIRRGLRCMFPCSRINCNAKLVFNENCMEEDCEGRKTIHISVFSETGLASLIVSLSALVLLTLIVGGAVLYYGCKHRHYRNMIDVERSRLRRLRRMGMGIRRRSDREYIFENENDEEETSFAELGARPKSIIKNPIQTKPKPQAKTDEHESRGDSICPAPSPNEMRRFNKPMDDLDSQIKKKLANLKKINMDDN